MGIKDTDNNTNFSNIWEYFYHQELSTWENKRLDINSLIFKYTEKVIF